MKFDPAGQRILIIDDEPNNLSVISAFLEKHGLDIMMAKNGKEGVELAIRGGPDLIILDVIMPGMDGYETMHQLRESAETAHIPVLFLTALNDVEDKLKAFVSGAMDYLSKPVQEEELLARVMVHLQVNALKLALEEKNQRLEKALDTGSVVNVAIGLLMERHRISLKEAEEALRTEARHQRRKMRDLAQELLDHTQRMDGLVPGVR
uniref:Putative response regulator protein[Include response regulator receiver domain and ANTAR domain] n=1 Tax=Magnetococcus massalia (strain MO-1) TaxID=451514 RepID=A0A1S7LIL7_MAGMO|nr:putative response regulator protein[Include response regulator receiver domain and ANTAR domain] [Candidatus Magnetococcus massalia]